MIEIDGGVLSGGGQIIRTALALSAHTNKPFKIKDIRSKRPRPGLRHQHLECVKTLRTLCNADVEGAHIGSTSLTFIPHGFTPQPLDIHIGTAGSITLLLQALSLPAMHHKRTKYTIHGGTDVLWSPPLDYLRYVILPHIKQFGNCSIELKRRGYYPQGGGSVEVTMGLTQHPEPITLIERGTLQSIHCVTTASRELMNDEVTETVERTLRVVLDDLEVPLQFRNAYSSTMDPKYSTLVYALFSIDHPRPLFGADIIGDEVNSPMEAAEKVAVELKNNLSSDGVIDEHLADHLIPFMALHGGEIITTKITGHIKACIHVSELFTGAKFTIDGTHIRVLR